MFVASQAHRKSNPEDGIWVYVDASKESADLYIMNHVQKYDIVVTQDIGLASLVLPKHVYALSPRGTIYSEDSIMTSLDFRYLAAKERRKGKYGKGPKPFTTKDRDTFEMNYKEILSKVAGIY